MSKEEEDRTSCSLTLKIPAIKAESEAQTSGLLVLKAPDDTNSDTMEDQEKQSLRKRRNLSKNRGQAARQREKTPEPSRTPLPHEDTPTSEEEEDDSPPRSSREVEADKMYSEMKRMVQQKTAVKDPVYDIDTQEILEARVSAAVERRRRSISPFALPDKEELSELERKGSFIDPTNKLLSTNYNISPKDLDKNRRGSLVLETPPVKENKNTLSPPSSGTASPKDNDFSYPMPSTPKKQEQMVYADEEKLEDDKPRKMKSPLKKEGDVFTFDEKDTKPASKAALKLPESAPGTPGEIVTRVIQVERVPSKKLLATDKKPTVEVRERIVRTPSRKMSFSQTNVPKQNKPKEEQQRAPVKPARSKSATRLGVSFYVKILLLLVVALLIALCFFLT